jgi:hypothetical protein
MEPKGSLLCSQWTAAGPYSEAVHTVQYYFLEIHVNIIVPFMCIVCSNFLSLYPSWVQIFF